MCTSVTYVSLLESSLDSLQVQLHSQVIYGVIISHFDGADLLSSKIDDVQQQLTDDTKNTMKDDDQKTGFPMDSSVSHYKIFSLLILSYNTPDDGFFFCPVLQVYGYHCAYFGWQTTKQKSLNDCRQ